MHPLAPPPSPTTTKNNHEPDSDSTYSHSPNLSHIPLLLLACFPFCSVGTAEPSSASSATPVLHPAPRTRPPSAPPPSSSRAPDASRPRPATGIGARGTAATRVRGVSREGLGHRAASPRVSASSASRQVREISHKIFTAPVQIFLHSWKRHRMRLVGPGGSGCEEM